MQHSVFFCSDELAAIDRTIGLIPATICCFGTVRVAALGTRKLEAWRVIAGVAADADAEQLQLLIWRWSGNFDVFPKKYG